MAQKKHKQRTKLFRWRQRSLDQGVIESFFSTIFLTNTSEKKKTLALFKKTKVQFLLFYTDVRNLPNILQNGLVPLKNLKLKPHEIYRVWSFDQDEENVRLEFDLSSRGNFWKWTHNLDFDPTMVAVIGINPKRLSELTQKDWLIDWAQNMIVISEPIYGETFDWILVQNVLAYKKVKELATAENYQITLYYGQKGIVKTQKRAPKNPLSAKKVEPKGEAHAKTSH